MMSEAYDDIIHLPHHVSKKHPQMSLYDRAAQFAPFAALTGMPLVLKGKNSEDKKWLDADEAALLDQRLNHLSRHIKERPEVSITYYEPFFQKPGGIYKMVHGIVKTVDENAHELILTNGTTIPIDSLLSLEAPLFEDMGTI
jgi:hypothetical protein